jgi:hypothetical protein
VRLIRVHRKDGHPLALKNGSSQTLELAELIQLIKAFEAQNSVEVVLTGQIVDGVKATDLRWTAFAYEGDPDEPGAKYSASASVRCLEKRLVRMEDVILGLLYALDFQLAENEFVKLGTQKA